MAATRLTLLRAPRATGSWTWWPAERAAGPVEQAATAGRLTAITVRHGLLRPTRVACRWELDGRAVPGAWAQTGVAGTVEPADLIAGLAAARPEHLPERARIGELVITGTGTWFGETGAPRTEAGLLELTVETAMDDPSVGIEVFHDIWMSHDFHGRPHPGLRARNAPRLAELLADIGTALDAEAEPGEATSFGHAVDLGVENPADDDDVPLDVTELILDGDVKGNVEGNVNGNKSVPCD